MRHLHPRARVKSLLFASLAVLSCTDRASEPSDPSGGDDLPLGDVQDDKADGTWGSALTCKDIPSLPALANPKIVISLDGLTLHLTGDGYDKVFPIGPGAIDQTDTDAEFGESRSYEPIIHFGKSDFAINWAASTPCKTWWTDPESGAKSPVFAGLPFMSWSGNYAIHGPIDNFRAANGGNLRRGYVSHGCVRMEAADVLEVYARLHTVATVPVHVQRAPERLASGKTVDLAAKWIGSQCAADADCNFSGGFCARDHVSNQGFCSARCTQYCSDKAGMPATFCVADPDAADKGMCVPRSLDTNYQCRPYDAFAPSILARFHQPTTTASVCAPHSRGWVGDHCLADGDCTMGTSCKGATQFSAGVCTSACDKVCADQPGWADTFCAAVPALAAGGSCVRQCTPSSNASECPVDMACAALPRNGQATVTRNVCVPKSATISH